MDLREFVVQSMESSRRATLNMVQGLTAQQLRWQPGPEANHVAFLLFHIFRTEDRYFHTWVGQEGELWDRGGWSARWKLPAPRSNPDPNWTTGNSWTAQEVRSWPPPPLEELLAYGIAVRASALPVVRGLDLGRLQETPRPDRPQVTIADYLHRASHHEASHSGQIDYLLGLARSGSR